MVRVARLLNFLNDTVGKKSTDTERMTKDRRQKCKMKALEGKSYKINNTFQRKQEKVYKEKNTSEKIYW